MDKYILKEIMIGPIRILFSGSNQATISTFRFGPTYDCTYVYVVYVLSYTARSTCGTIAEYLTRAKR